MPARSAFEFCESIEQWIAESCRGDCIIRHTAGSKTRLVLLDATGHDDRAACVVEFLRPIVERDGALIMVDDDRMQKRLRPGEEPEMRLVRFRTLGCYPLTGAVESSTVTIEEIVSEMLTATTSERQGRVIDHDENASMEKKKREGYF